MRLRFSLIVLCCGALLSGAVADAEIATALQSRGAE